jgi:hypothetical protein
MLTMVFKTAFLLLALSLIVKPDMAQAQTVTDERFLQSTEIVRLSSTDKAQALLPYKIANPVSRFFQTVTGLTPLSQFILDQALQTVIHHQVGGKVRVKVKLWSFTDLLTGKIKGARLSLKDASYKGVPMGIVQAQISKPLQLNYVVCANGKKKLKQTFPALICLKLQVREKDLAGALANSKVANALKAMNLDLPGLGQQQLELLNARVDLDNQLMSISGILVTKGAEPETGVPLTVSGNLILKGDDTIVLERANVDCKTIVDAEHFARFLEDLLNPIISLHRFDKPNRALRLDTLVIAKGLVITEGRMILAP